jgi:hypothetical protein
LAVADPLDVDRDPPTVSRSRSTTKLTALVEAATGAPAKLV